MKYVPETRFISSTTAAHKFSRICLESFRFKQYGRSATLRIDPEKDTQELLRGIIDRTNVIKFDTTSASLHEIFVAGGRRRSTLGGGGW